MKTNEDVLHCGDELKKLIGEHPELPIIFISGTEPHDDSSIFCTWVRSELSEFLDWDGCNGDYDEMYFTDRDDFQEYLEYLWGNEDDLDDLVAAEMERVKNDWIRCIEVYVSE